jgi:hypothetical protein
MTETGGKEKININVIVRLTPDGTTNHHDKKRKIFKNILQLHHPRCVFMQMRVGGSVKTQLSYDRDLLV